MNKQDYADKWSLSEWQTLCKSEDFTQAFWLEEFVVCDTFADNLLSGLELANH